MRRRLGTVLATALLPATFLFVGVAAAQSPQLEVRIREVSFATGDETQLVVSVSGPAVTGDALPPEAFTVTEQGTPVSGLQVEQLFSSGTQRVSVGLLIDTSRSTIPVLDQAKAAAKSFLDALPPQVQVQLISFDTAARTVRDFQTLGSAGSAERTAFAAAIDALPPGQETGTKLYDGVVLAADELGRQSGQHNLVIFSDGNDAGSESTLDRAVSSVKTVRAPATTVLLTTGGVDEKPLRDLAAAQKGGAFIPVEDTTALSVAFGQVAQAISSQYILTYTATATTPTDLNIGVGVAADGVTGTDTTAVINQRASVSPEGPKPADDPLVPFLGSGKIGLFLGIMAAFIGIAVFLGLLIYRPEGKRAEQLLARGLRLYTRGAKEKKKKQTEGSFLGQSGIGRAAVELAERVPRSKAFDEKMQLQLDQAGWPLRSSEFILLQVGGLLVGALLGFGLVRSAIVGVMLTILGAVAPRLALSQRMAKRQSSFLEHLPDTLQLLSGSLQAGYGFLQALDTVAKEAVPPTSTEFARVLTEARLGMPLEDALDNMAERVGGEDFKWVVLAINIQRQVGGNLAALLTTVANTLREREQVRRQIKVLSAEGRLSAVILVVLPFALVGYLSVVNPQYLSQLTAETVGKISIAIALVLIGIGIVWMRKIIKIDV